MSEKSKSVDLSNIVKRFGSFTAVDNVSINIAAGEFCTLLGPSGSGKTTLLKIIAGYETPTEGEVKVDGQDVSHVPVENRNVGMVFQNYALFPHMTIAKNIAFPLEMRKTPKAEIEKRVQETLELVGLGELGGRYPRELSGGQQQRVAVARALVFEPDILLMDEPLGALDKNLRQAMQYELKKLHRRIGVTIVYVTHDQEEALYLSDQIVVFNEGRVAQKDAPETLYNKPNSSFVADFLGECNLFDASIFKNISIKDEISKIGIRPERLAIGEQASSKEKQIEAIVEEILFLGQGYKIIAKSEEKDWAITLANNIMLPDFNVGDTVSIGFDADDLILLKS